MCGTVLACHLFTDTEPVFFFFLSQEDCSVAKLMFISFILFQFGCFSLSVGAFNQFTTKVHVGILVQQYYVSCVNPAKRQLVFVLSMYSCLAG